MAVPKVANGQTATDTQYNALVDAIEDLTVGHAHAGTSGDGQKINHANLVDGALGGYNHAQIGAHIAASQAVHGLPASAHMTGVLNTAYYLEVGSAETDGSYDANAGWRNGTKTVTTDLDTVVGALICPLDTCQTHGVGQISGNSFLATVALGSKDPAATKWFTWLAWGLKA